MGWCALLPEICLTQGSNLHLLCLLHWQPGSLPLMPAWKPIIRLAGNNIISKNSKVSYMQKKNLLIQQIFTECVLYLMSSLLLLMLFSRKVVFAIPWPQHAQLPCLCSDYLPEFAQIHVQWVGDATQPSHPLPLILPSISPSIRVFFQGFITLHQVAKVLELQFQHQCF